MRQTTAGMENFRDLLDKEEKESIYKIHMRALICCSLMITHFLMLGGGLMSGVFMCQDGYIDCSYDGSSN